MEGIVKGKLGFIATFFALFYPIGQELARELNGSLRPAFLPGAVTRLGGRLLAVTIGLIRHPWTPLCVEVTRRRRQGRNTVRPPTGKGLGMLRLYATSDYSRRSARYPIPDKRYRISGINYYSVQTLPSHEQERAGGEKPIAAAAVAFTNPCREHPCERSIINNNK
jgi:hypothetical protein